MEIIWTRTKTIVSLCLFVAAVAAVVVKLTWFPQVDDKFFRLENQELQAAPANVLILRPTKFEGSRQSGKMVTARRDRKSGRIDPNQMLMVGRNVSLADVIATAYQCQPSRVLLPPGTPADRYDFLVTVREAAVEKFQARIKKQLGYVAQWKDAEAEVLQLKVQVPGHPGLKLSPPGASGGSSFTNGRLYFKHAPVQQLVWLSENGMNQPVTDATGLAGEYDFAVPWEWRGGRFGRDTNMVKKALADLGLVLVSRDETLSLMTVERTH